MFAEATRLRPEPNESVFAMNRRNLLHLLGAVGLTQAAVARGSAAVPQSTNLLLRPQDFGARVDGTTLDSPAINAASFALMVRAAGWST